jgi:hypothetical protein
MPCVFPEQSGQRSASRRRQYMGFFGKVLSNNNNQPDDATTCPVEAAAGVVAPQNHFNVKSSWEKRTELKSLHTDVISS